MSEPPPYNRELLVDVLVYHWRTTTSGCGCGWNQLGRSHPDHIADVYEQSVALRANPRSAAEGEHRTMSLLVDVSSNQPPIDWQQVAKHGVEGVYVKATEGVTYVNPRALEQIGGARSAGLDVGIYHFARPDRNAAKDEATHFLTAASQRPGELRPVLDYETANRLTPAEEFTWITTFNKAVRDRLGVWPMFYSYRAFIAELKLPRPVGNGLWLADYGPDDGTEHPAPAPPPWKHVALHQFTSRGSVPGIPGRVDLSHTDSLARLRA